MSAVTVDGSAPVRKRPTTRVGDFLARRRSLVGTVSGLALLVAEPRPTMMAAGLALMLVAYSLRVLCADASRRTRPRRGPYAWCRNSPHVANLLAVLAFGLMSGLWLAPRRVSIWLPHLPVARGALLRERFGAQFEHCARTALVAVGLVRGGDATDGPSTGRPPRSVSGHAPRPASVGDACWPTASI